LGVELEVNGLVVGGGWQAKPLEGGGGGRESPPSLKSRVGGWWLAGKTSHSRFERARWCWWVCRLVLVGAYANTYQCWGWVATAPIPTLVVALSPLPALLVVMVVVVVHVVDVGEWCGGGGIEQRR